MDLTIRIADKDADRVINQAADTWDYRLQVANKEQESKQQYVLRYLKTLLLNAASVNEIQQAVEIAQIAAKAKFDEEVTVDVVEAIKVTP